LPAPPASGRQRRPDRKQQIRDVPGRKAREVLIYGISDLLVFDAEAQRRKDFFIHFSKFSFAPSRFCVK
jgi:hypothetical protein